jgi:hypothetical protein
MTHDVDVGAPGLAALERRLELVANLLARLEHGRKQVQVGMDRGGSLGLALG